MAAQTCTQAGQRAYSESKTRLRASTNKRASAGWNLGSDGLI